MSIEQEYGKFCLVCDNCGDIADQEFDTFYGAVDAKEGLGWKMVNASGVLLEDWCPDCCEREGR